MVQPVNVNVEPWDEEALAASLAPAAQTEKPLIGSYAVFKSLRSRGANMRRYDILMHTPTCQSIRLPAGKALKWAGPSKGFHFTDNCPSQPDKSEARRGGSRKAEAAPSAAGRPSLPGLKEE